MMLKAKVIKPHVSEFPDPIRICAGDRVSVEDRTTTWPGWVWCRTGDAQEGWVPLAYVQRDGNSGIVARDYHATELTIDVGEILEVLEEESGWLLCRTETDIVGWVPVENTECVE